MRKLITATAALAAVAFATPANAQFSIVSAHPMSQWTPTSRAGSNGSGSYLAVTYLYDDSSSENAVGIVCNAATCNPPTIDIVWAFTFDTMNPAFANSTSDTITRVDVAIGAFGATSAPPVGTPIDVYVFEDPANTGNPGNLTAGDLVTQGSGTNTNPNMDFFEQIPVPPGVVAGKFFVVAVMASVIETTPPTGVGEFPAALDTSAQSLGRSWVNAFGPGGAWTPMNPQSSSLGGWKELDAVGLPGLWLLRAEGTGSGPTSFCTAKTTTVCGAAMASAAGVPSATASSGFTIGATPTRGCRSGLLLYSNQPIVPGVPFAGPGDGKLCLNPQGLRRAGPIESGGTSPATCDGNMSIDMNAFRALGWMATGCAPPAGQTNPAGFLSNMGTTVNTQIWGRDSTATGQVLSDGISYQVGP